MNHSRRREISDLIVPGLVSNETATWFRIHWKINKPIFFVATEDLMVSLRSNIIRLNTLSYPLSKWNELPINDKDKRICISTGTIFPRINQEEETAPLSQSHFRKPEIHQPSIIVTSPRSTFSKCCASYSSEFEWGAFHSVRRYIVRERTVRSVVQSATRQVEVCPVESAVCSTAHKRTHATSHTDKQARKSVAITRWVARARKTRPASGDSIHWLKSPSICHCQGGGDSLSPLPFSFSASRSYSPDPFTNRVRLDTRCSLLFKQSKDQP